METNERRKLWFRWFRWFRWTTHPPARANQHEARNRDDAARSYRSSRETEQIGSMMNTQGQKLGRRSLGRTRESPTLREITFLLLRWPKHWLPSARTWIFTAQFITYHRRTKKRRRCFANNPLNETYGTKLWGEGEGLINTSVKWYSIKIIRWYGHRR